MVKSLCNRQTLIERDDGTKDWKKQLFSIFLSFVVNTKVSACNQMTLMNNPVVCSRMQSVAGVWIWIGSFLNVHSPGRICQGSPMAVDVPSPESAGKGVGESPCRKNGFQCFSLPPNTHRAKVQFYNIAQDQSGLSEEFHLHWIECLWWL